MEGYLSWQTAMFWVALLFVIGVGVLMCSGDLTTSPQEKSYKMRGFQ